MQQPRVNDAGKAPFARPEEAQDIHAPRNQDWMQSVFEYSLDGVFSLDREGRFTAVNPACEKISGYTRDELLRLNFAQLCTPDCLEKAVHAFEKDREGDPQVVDISIFRKDGRQVDLLATGGPITVDGHIVGVFAIVHDVTENKQANSALRESEEQFRLLVEGVKDYALFLLDPAGNIVTWNKGAERLKGYRAEEIIGRSSALCFVPEDVLQGLPQRVLRVAAQQGRYKGECWVVRKDGSKFWSELLLVALRNEDGTLRGFAEVAQDITDRKRAEEELTRAKEAAEQASRAKDHFLAILSHELRTPLTPVLAAVQMAERESALSPDLSALLNMIHRNVELEARLIDDLLDVVSISRGKIELHLGSLDLHALLQHVVEVCSSDLQAKQLTLSVELDAPHHHVHGDSARLQQVFWNLLKNAVKFTPIGGRIALRTDPAEEDRIAVTVRDTGVGIEPELLPHIFNVFEQGGPQVTRLFGGLGLGLSISKGLVEMHGGTLRALSEGKNQGASFIVELNTSVSAESSTPACRPGERQAADLQGGRVLLVEDHPDTARTMAMLLRSYGYDVRTADSINSALRAADAEPFDLLISDLGLPDGSGHDLMRRLSAQHPTKGIAISGYGTEEDIRHSKEAGFMAHLTKPIDTDQLEKIMKAACIEAHQHGNAPPAHSPGTPQAG